MPRGVRYPGQVKVILKNTYFNTLHIQFYTYRR
jgi:hypothetical protein